MAAMKPKPLSVFIFCFSGALMLGAEEPRPEIRLRGIVEFSTNQLALLEATTLPGWPGEMILLKGQREEAIEVLEIDATAGKVRIRNAGTISEIGFTNDLPPGAWFQSSSEGQRAEPSGSPAFLRLQGAGPSHVFRLYQLLVGRSLIRAQSLPAFRLDLGCKDTATTEDLVKAIEQALAPKGILFLQDGDKFVLAGRESDFNNITPQLWELAETLTKNRSKAAPGTAEEMLPTGTINFPATDLSQVLMIYQELVNKTLLRSATLPAFTVSLRSYTPWTITEAIYAFNAALAINGISVVPVGEKFLFVFPTIQKEKMDSLLKAQMPVHASSGKEPLPAGSFRGMLGLKQGMAVYQDLCGKPVEIEAGLPDIPFTFRNQTPLMVEEVLYALDLLLGWNGLEVTQHEDGLQLVRRKEAK